MLGTCPLAKSRTSGLKLLLQGSNSDLITYLKIGGDCPGCAGDMRDTRLWVKFGAFRVDFEILPHQAESLTRPTFNMYDTTR